MKYLRTYLLMIFLVLTSCGLLGGSNSDDGPPRTIVFSAQDNGGAFQIYSMREDGSGVKQLTEGEYSSTEPAWSPDGKRIAYSRSTGSTAGEALWVMDADGSNKQPLVTNPHTGNPQLGNRPAWSPDGTKLAFDQCLNCEIGGSNFDIFVADLKTGAIDTLTHHPVEDSHPTWSPDGKGIAFVSQRDYFDADTLRFRKDLYVINADGSNRKRLTETGYAREPVWNTIDNTITFRSTSSSPGLYSVSVQSENITMVKKDTDARTHLHPHIWSPDGSRLLMTARSLDSPRENALSILEVNNESLDKIFSKSFNTNPGILGADWFIPGGN